MRISDWCSDVCSSDLDRIVALRGCFWLDVRRSFSLVGGGWRNFSVAIGTRVDAMDLASDFGWTLPMSFTAVPLTLYPDMFPGPLGHSMAGRALESGTWHCAPVQIRDFATDKHRTVDDTPAGGGPGMVLKR